MKGPGKRERHIQMTEGKRPVSCRSKSTKAGEKDTDAELLGVGGRQGDEEWVGGGQWEMRGV